MRYKQISKQSINKISGHSSTRVLRLRSLSLVPFPGGFIPSLHANYCNKTQVFVILNLTYLLCQSPDSLSRHRLRRTTPPSPQCDLKRFNCRNGKNLRLVCVQRTHLKRKREHREQRSRCEFPVCVRSRTVPCISTVEKVVPGQN